MIIGVPKEVKQGEFRVGLTPAGAEALRAAGHSVRVERGAGEPAGFDDAQYRKARVTLGTAAGRERPALR